MDDVLLSPSLHPTFTIHFQLHFSANTLITYIIMRFSNLAVFAAASVVCVSAMPAPAPEAAPEAAPVDYGKYGSEYPRTA